MSPSVWEHYVDTIERNYIQIENVPNILLIDTNTTHFNEATPIYPIGLDYLQGALRKAGFTNAQIFDLRERWVI
jgi:hypothetical protein